LRVKPVNSRQFAGTDRITCPPRPPSGASESLRSRRCASVLRSGWDSFLSPLHKRGDYGFDNATFLLANLTNQSYIYLEKDVSNTDQYGRLLRNIFVNELFVNEVMVRYGWATVWDVPPDVKHSTVLHQAETQAKDKKRGLWAPR
jgi:hypothetical protein